MAMILKHAPFIGEVLEIGCGLWTTPRSCVHGNWTGLDPRWTKDYPSGRNILGGEVKDIPLSDASFDWVISFASVEHWSKNNDTIESGIAEIYRVLKMGGRLLLHCPMRIHGRDIFVLGNEDAIIKEIQSSPWDRLEIEHWRKDYDPLLPVYSKTIQKMKPRWADVFGDVVPSTYHMEILAVK